MLNFLRHVLPARGNYVLSILTTRTDGETYLKNHHAGTIEELEEEAKRFDNNPTKTVFYGLGSFKDNLHPSGKVGRSQAEAHMFKTLAFDVDPKDRDDNVLYVDQRAMVMTTMKACTEIGIPDPVFVKSGNGIHCYYPLTEPLSKDMWTRVSTMLRDALLATGMELDRTKVCDASMVLRPVGTHNKKNGVLKEVKLLGQLRLYDPMVLAMALKKFVKPAAPKRTSVGKKSAVMDAILNVDWPPLNSTLIESRCQQIASIAASGGDVKEPWWWTAMGLAKYCEDNEAVAIRWSDGHADFTAERSIAKMNAWKADGPPGCKQFHELSASSAAVCEACPRWGHIRGPAQLGVPDVLSQAATSGTDTMRPLKGYTYSGDKILRVVDGEASLVSEYLLYPVKRYKDSKTGKTLVLVAAKLPKEGWCSFEMPMDTVSKMAEFQSWLLNHQLFVHNEAILQAMRRFMLTYLQELQQETESDILCGEFGWMDEDCKEFVLGDKAVALGGEKAVRLNNAAVDYAGAFVSRGDKQAWVDATAMYNQPGMQLYGLCFLMSMGSPLMVGSGLKSVLVNMFTDDSGTGKTTTGLFANSAYGDPEKLKMTVKDTDNSLFKSMGVFGNLPVYIDEITGVGVDPQRLGQITYFVTQGREKKRMNKDGTLQASAEWDSLTLASSNKDMYSLLGEQSTFDGQSMRLLQFKVPKNPVFNSDDGSEFGYKMSMFLKKNYGLVGADFVRGIIAGGGPAHLFENGLASFKKRYPDFVFSGKERFWQGAMVIAYVTGKMCDMLGLAKIDYDACIRAGLDQIRQLRGELADNAIDSFETLGVYLSEHASKVVVHKKNTDQKNDGAVVAPYPHEAVARIEAECTHKNPFVTGRLYVNQVHFNRWAHDRGIDRKGMVSGLIANGVKLHKDRRIALMRGTDKALPAVRVFEIDLNHPRFVSVMSQNDLGIIPPVHLKLVS